MRSFFKWIRSIFKKEQPRPVGPIEYETPAQARDRYDQIEAGDYHNDGTTRAPDFTYLATTAKLDGLASQMSTIAYYYNLFLKVESQLKDAEQLAQAPWWFLAGIDMREMSFNHSGHFANGDKIIGTGRKTYRVPAGLGPADTWAQSVEQALAHERTVNSRFRKLVRPDMTLAEACEAWEIYNGLGFRGKGEYSEYVFAFTNHHDETGRYVADGKFSTTSKVVRPGALAFVLYLEFKGKVDFSKYR